MIQITPSPDLSGYPCSIVAVACALKGEKPKGLEEYLTSLREDGYATLDKANKFIRANLPVKKAIYYKRYERPRLCDLNYDRALVCVYGHLVYLEEDKYYSFFDNENDEVVKVWIL